jgi:hypothetical protein
VAGTARILGWRTISRGELQLPGVGGVVDQLELDRYPRGGQFPFAVEQPVIERQAIGGQLSSGSYHGPARASTLRERAAIAIIKDVPRVNGSELFQSVGNPATIGVKQTTLAARGA